MDRSGTSVKPFSNTFQTGFKLIKNLFGGFLLQAKKIDRNFKKHMLYKGSIGRIAIETTNATPIMRCLFGNNYMSYSFPNHVRFE
jgi:hypothetical protein